jgi:hypothetical protein
MKKRNLKRDGTPKLGRPTGATDNRGKRPWDHYDEHAISAVAENPDLPRWKIAEQLGISLSKLSTITCSPKGEAMLKQYRDPEE